ncbi:hypothetical protein [Martelella endophytica]|uniref:Uncharacterized protein n=1 Tax=Martelella endophytica TaxID=1486262 RepID=A0A0D5LKH8_MAREN|nr:hypothetical protein [Martelella endophytica]AJY44656.1 hypothetical protein TM49_01495 [Martelella endophytica]
MRQAKTPGDLLTPVENLPPLPEASPDVYEATALLIAVRQQYRVCQARNAALVKAIDVLEGR